MDAKFTWSGSDPGSPLPDAAAAVGQSDAIRDAVARGTRRGFTREVGDFELDEADLEGHPAACPGDVLDRLRTAALKLGLSIQVGARRVRGGSLGRLRDGTWERYIVVTDERLPASLQVQTTTLKYGEEWADAARRIGLWPTR